MDEFELLELLPKSPFASNKDRYNAFRQLFMGSDQGKQVLYEILSWGKLFDVNIHASPIDQVALNIDTGMKNFSIKLLSVVNNEPPDPPEKTTTKPKRTR